MAEGRPERVSRFLKRRFTRLYPIYWIYAGIFSALVVAGFGTAANSPHGLLQWLTTFSLVRFANMLTPISPAWTLFHEIAFYAVFAAMIVNRRFGIVLFATWQIACLAMFQYPFPEERTPFHTYFAAYNLDFAIGMLAFYMSTKQNSASSVFYLFCGGFLFLATLGYESAGYDFVGLPVLYALSFGAIILSSVGLEKRWNEYKLWFLVFLGDADLSAPLIFYTTPKV